MEKMITITFVPIEGKTTLFLSSSPSLSAVEVATAFIEYQSDIMNRVAKRMIDHGYRRQNPESDAFMDSITMDDISL